MDDHLSKYAHFIALRHPFTAHTVVGVFTKEVIRLHRTPCLIIFDCDKVFLSLFWTELFHCRVPLLSITRHIIPKPMARPRWSIVASRLTCVASPPTSHGSGRCDWPRRKIGITRPFTLQLKLLHSDSLQRWPSSIDPFWYWFNYRSFCGGATAISRCNFGWIKAPPNPCSRQDEGFDWWQAPWCAVSRGWYGLP